MKSFLRLLLFTLGLPILAIGVAWATTDRLDDSLRAQLRHEYPAVSEQIIAQTTIDSLSKDGKFAPGSELPRIYSRLQLVQKVAIGSGVIGLLLIAAIYFAGLITRTRRDLLLRLFRPGVFATLILVGLLTIVQATALAGALYYYEFVDNGGKDTVGAYSIAIMIGGVLAIVAVARAIFSTRHVEPLQVVGHRITSEEQPGIWAIVRETCHELNATVPDNVVLGLEPTFFVTESPVVAHDQKLRGRTLFLSLSFSRLLTPVELRAIIGHEMAHFMGDDTKFSHQFFPVYRGTLLAISHLSRHRAQISRVVPRHIAFLIFGLALSLPLFPAITFLGFFFESFIVSEKNLSRIRETAADAVGASVGGATNLATALVKTSVYGQGWQNILVDVRYDNEELRGHTNLSLPFQAMAVAVPPDAIAKAGNKQVSHPVDSHPTLAIRLQSLQIDLAAVLPFIAVPLHDASAAALIVGLPSIEEEQTQILRLKVRPV